MIFVFCFVFYFFFLFFWPQVSHFCFNTMYKSLLALLVLCLICWIIQLLPVISVPLTPLSSKIYLSCFENFTFGVFGICDERSGKCSDARIGYPSSNSSNFVLQDNYDGVVLPSDVKYTISKLLVVHVVAFCFSSLLMTVICLLFALESVDRWRYQMKPRQEIESEEEREEREQREESEKRDLTPYLNMMLILTIMSVLTTLLAFLADILLFTPNLSYLGWIQLIPIISMALITSMLCFIKRSIASRKFFENYDYQYDDMKKLRKRVMEHSWDNSSDDGFFVYTDGFYTRGEETNISNTSLSSTTRQPRGSISSMASSTSAIELNNF